MTARLFSATIIGIDGVEVEVETDVRPAPEPHILIVGLPDAAVKESTQRVESAITNSSLSLPLGTIIINLAPADLKKQGPAFDLPIALGIITCASQANWNAEEWCIMGELALDGSVRPLRGVLPQVIEARERGRTRIMVPVANGTEAAAVQGVSVYPVETLADAWNLLTKGEGLPLAPTNFSDVPPESTSEFDVDFDEVKGQFYARRAMEVAAAGRHNILMCGSPGSGKSMLSRRLTTILPPLDEAESLETSRIHSVCGLLKREAGLMHHRPFRSPHHTISDVGLMGGGSNITPGEISLAHNGVLFLDELPEFRRQTLETLRQPLESGEVVISRASGTMTFPCRFMLVAAMNPCPCGYLGDRRHHCRCGAAQISRYRQKISGPLLDRFDLIMEVPAVDPSLLASAPSGESSAVIRERVLTARHIQSERYQGTPFRTNADLSGKALATFCQLSPTGSSILLDAISQLGLSARAHDRILKVARTIADLAESPNIEDAHLFEAIQFRSFENSLR
jgi:magnesium chelatase family protein